MMNENNKGNYGVEIVGPFLPEYRVTFGGFRVPHISARPLDDGSIEVVIDNRFGMPASVPREEFERWVPILANAMAVAAGYSCLGENCTPLNNFKVKMSGLAVESPRPSFELIDGGKSSDQEPRP